MPDPEFPHASAMAQLATHHALRTMLTALFALEIGRSPDPAAAKLRLETVLIGNLPAFRSAVLSDEQSDMLSNAVGEIIEITLRHALDWAEKGRLG